MTKGVIFSLSNILGGLIVGLLFAVGVEFLMVEVVFNYILSSFGNFNVTINIVYIFVLALFICQIFSKRNITNFLFLSGYTRKNINTIKTISVFIVTTLALIITVAMFTLYSFHANFSGLLNVESIIYILIIYLKYLAFSEFAIYINILYRNKSMKKAKGVNKKLYSYIYTLILVIIIYVYRGFSTSYTFQEYFWGTNFTLITGAISLFVFFVMYILNRKTILKLDIK